MKSFDVSQVPVIEQDEIIVLIDETDVLLAVIGNPSGFSMQAGSVMNDKLVKLPVDRPLNDLVPVFERGHIVAVTDQDKFLGLITPIDFLNHLRKRTGKA